VESVEPAVAESIESEVVAAAPPVLAEPAMAAARDNVVATLHSVRSPAPPAEPVRRDLPQDPLGEIRDDVDTQVLPIFLEEAAELYPQAGECVRAWRRAPGDDTRVRQLRRTLHTFKGSARMAGAMRLGELVHLMESRLDVDGAPVPGSVDLFEALDGDLDRIAFVLDALREGRPTSRSRGVTRTKPPRARRQALLLPTFRRPLRQNERGGVAAVARECGAARGGRGPPTSKRALARCFACAPTSSTGWSTRRARSRSRGRESKASFARSRPTCSSSPAA
jgi:HPt (histidine-containing phosphotransfer) domain-containing protein